VKSINNEKQYKIAEERIEELLSMVDNTTPNDDVNFIELSRLSDIVADYEEAHFPVAKPKIER
jgi:HTH-type transcriptional regulator/antitoxin HigA